jgi:isoquinoline 1-oxidoreductase alpha subunit
MILNVNNKNYDISASNDMPLLWALRDIIGLTGTKYGCGIGVCGSCTVLINDVAERSCLTTVQEAIGKKITTIEGLSTDNSHPLQKAWVSENVTQCGYCQPGQMMQAASLLKQYPNPTDEQIDAEMQGNICRCGTYNRIKVAIKIAAKG